MPLARSTACLFFLSFAALSEPSKVRVAGAPPLTEEMIRRYSDFFEWAFEVQLTAEQRTRVESYLVGLWTGRKKDDIGDALEVIDQQKQLQEVPENQRALAREQVADKLLEQVRAEAATDAMARWALDVYESSHRPIAEGNPPLTRQASDSYGEVLCFMLGEVAGRKVVAARQFKDDLAAVMVAAYPNLSADDRATIAKMPTYWAAIRAAWPSLPGKQKGELKEQWGNALAAMLPPKPAEAPETAAAPSDKTAQQKIIDQLNAGHGSTQWLSNAAMSHYAGTMTVLSNMPGSGWSYRR